MMKTRNPWPYRLLAFGGLAAVLSFSVTLRLEAQANDAGKAQANPPAASAGAAPQANSTPPSDTPAAPAQPPKKRKPTFVAGAYPDAVPPPQAGINPPDGIWLKDTEGREYYLDKVPKAAGKYKWLNDHQVSYMGAKLDVDHQDDANFYIKIYQVKTWDRQVNNDGPTAAERKALFERYAVQLATVDRLTFEKYSGNIPGDLASLKDSREVYPRQYGSGDIRVGDLNGDGLPDLVLGDPPPKAGEARAVPASTSQGARSLATYLNQGKGLWKRLDSGPEGGLQNPAHPLTVLQPGASMRGVTTNDFNGDGRADIGIGYVRFEDGAWRAAIDLFYARPNGTWERHPLFADPIPNALIMVASGDIDGDGAIDVFSSDHDGNLRIYLGDGKGTFSEERTPELAVAHGLCQGERLQLVDLDGDGHNELVAVFSGEGNAHYDPQRCLDRGGANAWKVRASKAR